MNQTEIRKLAKLAGIVPHEMTEAEKLQEEWDKEIEELKGK